MREPAAGRVHEARAFALVRHFAVLDDLLVAGSHVFLVFLQHLAGLLGDDGGFDAARGGPAERGEQIAGRQAEGLQHAVDHRDDLGVALEIGHQNLRERAGFHGAPVVAGSLHPRIAILVAHEGELGLGNTLERLMNRIARVPAVPYVLLDLRGIERQGFELAVEHHAGLEPPGFEIALVAGELAEGHKVGRAADLGPVLVRAADKQQIRDVDLIHEVVDFLVQAFEFGDALRRQAFVAGHAARHEELGVRVLRAEHRHGPRRLHL